MKNVVTLGRIPRWELCADGTDGERVGMDDPTDLLGLGPS